MIVAMRRGSWVVVCVVFGLLGACGAQRNATRHDAGSELSPERAVAVMGSQGGTLALTSGEAKGASIEIPPGALAGRTEITVRSGGTPTHVPKGAVVMGPVVVFGPNGQKFARPVTVTIPVTGAANALYARQDEDVVWTKVSDARYDPKRKIVEAKVTHFTYYVGLKVASTSTEARLELMGYITNMPTDPRQVSYDTLDKPNSNTLDTQRFPMIQAKIIEDPTTPAGMGKGHFLAVYESVKGGKRISVLGRSDDLLNWTRIREIGHSDQAEIEAIRPTITISTDSSAEADSPFKTQFHLAWQQVPDFKIHFQEYTTRVNLERGFVSQLGSNNFPGTGVAYSAPMPGEIGADFIANHAASLGSCAEVSPALEGLDRSVESETDGIKFRSVAKVYFSYVSCQSPGGVLSRLGSATVARATRYTADLYANSYFDWTNVGDETDVNNAVAALLQVPVERVAILGHDRLFFRGFYFQIIETLRHGDQGTNILVIYDEQTKTAEVQPVRHDNFLGFLVNPTITIVELNGAPVVVVSVNVVRTETERSHLIYYNYIQNP